MCVKAAPDVMLEVHLRLYIREAGCSQRRKLVQGVAGRTRLDLRGCRVVPSSVWPSPILFRLLPSQEHVQLFVTPLRRGSK